MQALSNKTTTGSPQSDGGVGGEDGRGAGNAGIGGFRAAVREVGARLAFKLFDSEGVAMVNVPANGADVPETVRRRARDLGIVLEEDLVRDAERARDELDIFVVTHSNC